jgi:RNA polymerase sigma factor (sigma-70 family)
LLAVLQPEEPHTVAAVSLFAAAAGAASSETITRAGRMRFIVLPFVDLITSTTRSTSRFPRNRQTMNPEPRHAQPCNRGTVGDRPLAESTLIGRAQRGDRAAYESLMERHQTIAFRLAWAITGSAADAEEATQDGFLKAYRALDRFRVDSPFRPWLLRIVSNEARNRRAATWRRAQLAVRVAEERRHDDAVPSPEAALLGHERRRELLEAVDRLPDPQRMAVFCRYFLELSEAETAAAMGTRPGTVKSRLSRARERLASETGAEHD